jgi:FKBP-type peptidyl-prolyl cis-trans isomerase FkpA
MINKFSRSILIFLTVVLILSVVSCNPAKKYEKAEREAIDNYLNNNADKNFEKKESGLYYSEVLAGTGRTPVAHDTATVIYTGQFLNGTVFDSNVSSTTKLVFPVGEGLMIAGFDEGITYMAEGGKALFLMPSSLAYGTQGYYTIAGYTPLLYEVELVKVVPGPGK